MCVLPRSKPPTYLGQPLRAGFFFSSHARQASLLRQDLNSRSVPYFRPTAVLRTSAFGYYGCTASIRGFLSLTFRMDEVMRREKLSVVNRATFQMKCLRDGGDKNTNSDRY